MRKICSPAFILGFLLAFAHPHAEIQANTDVAQSKIPDQLKNVGIVEHLGDTVNLSLKFKDEEGKEVELGSYFRKGKPVVLNLVYYGCHNLCSFVLNGLATSLKDLEWTPGNEFEVVTVSIDPKETPKMAAHKKDELVNKTYGRANATSGWHFLTGEEPQIRELAKQVGFGYEYDPEEGQYAHGAVIFSLTPEGRISRYLYGISYKKQDMKLSLLEASNGKIGTVVDRFLLFCYRYDPKTRKYSIYLTKLMQAGCGGTLVVFGGYLMLFWRRQRKGA